MYKLRFRAFIIFLLICAMYAACRKTDMPLENDLAKNVERFFKEHATANPLVAGAQQYLATQNAKTGFIQSLVAANGFAIWDKSLVIENTMVNQYPAALANDPANIVYIPLVRTEENFVNASLIVKMTSADTTFKILADWQYASYGFDSTSATSWNARDIFNIFSTLDRSVFGSTKFKITDGRIFGDSQQAQRTVTINTAPALTGAGSSNGNLFSMLTLCNSWTVCIIAGASTPFHRNETSTPGGVCNTYYYCTTVWVENGTSGGGGGSGGGTGTGGGGGTGGGSGGAGGTGGTGGTGGGTGGGHGWVPVSEENTPLPPNDSIISANLKRLYLKGKSKSDSLFTRSMTDSLERTFTYIRNGANDTVPMFFVTGTNYSSNPTLVYDYLAYWHSHQDEGPGNRDQCFDGADLHKLYYGVINKQKVQASLITTKNYIYAAVLTDTAKFRNYCISLAGGIKNNSFIEKKMSNLHINAWDNCSCSWHLGSEAGTLAITANNNSAVSGIKIFRSYRDSINFIPLTH